MSTISQFRNEHYFLSNFFPINLSVNGKMYPSAEHAFQAAKCVNAADAERIRKAATPSIARSMGRRVLLKPNWERKRISTMLEILILKFEVPQLKTLLKNTQGREIEESNTWHDIFWGTCSCREHGGEGRNVLGNFLMLVRDSK